MNYELHVRQRTSSTENPASGVHIGLNQSNIVLLTITTDQRKPWLANERANQLLRETWSEATAWLVGDYLLMPDHLHCFCAPRDLHFGIEAWIKYWKREFAIKQKRLVRTLAPPLRSLCSLWFNLNLPARQALTPPGRPGGATLPRSQMDGEVCAGADVRRGRWPAGPRPADCQNPAPEP